MSVKTSSNFSSTQSHLSLFPQLAPRGQLRLQMTYSKMVQKQQLLLPTCSNNQASSHLLKSISYKSSPPALTSNQMTVQIADSQYSKCSRVSMTYLQRVIQLKSLTTSTETSSMQLRRQESNFLVTLISSTMHFHTVHSSPTFSMMLEMPSSVMPVLSILSKK